jgi:hypothetical protein
MKKIEIEDLPIIALSSILIAFSIAIVIGAIKYLIS